MNKKEYLTNFKVMFTMFIVLVLLILLFLSSNIVHAVEVVPWLNSENSPYDDIPTLNSITFKSRWTYSDYNSDNTKQLVFDISNEKYFDNSMTIEDFYSNYNYAVYSFGESTIRVLVQDYKLMLENQGLNPISGNQTKFFLYNVGIFYKQSSTLYYHNGVGAFYNWIIDISYNSDSYVVRDEGNRITIKYMALKSQNGYDTINRNLNNIGLFDSYNGNLAWVESFNPIFMPTGFEALDISPPNYTYVTLGPYYYFNVFDIPELEYVSSGVPLPEEPGGGGESTSPDYTDIFEQFLEKFESIDNNTNESKGFLEGIGETLGKIGQSIGDGLNDLIEGISDTLDNISIFLSNILDDILDSINNILDFFKESWDTSPLETLKEKFVIDDFGEENFFMLISDYLGRVKDNSTTCKSISITLPFVNSNLNLPCMTDIYKKISPNFLDFYQIITTAIISFGIVLNIFDTIAIAIDPSIDLWSMSRENKDIVKVNSKTGEVVD